MTTQQLSDHVKAVGQAIIDDADKIAFDANDLHSIGIHAYIGPNTVTTVTYRLERIADPRRENRKESEDGRTEEEKEPE